MGILAFILGVVGAIVLIVLLCFFIKWLKKLHKKYNPTQDELISAKEKYAYSLYLDNQIEHTQRRKYINREEDKVTALWLKNKENELWYQFKDQQKKEW